MSDIKAIVLFIVFIGTFFWAVDVVERAIRSGHA
jgi:preprotein translocase subunit SecE